MRTIHAVFQNDGKWFIARCLDFPVTTQGKTLAAAKKNLLAAVELYLETWGDSKQEKPVKEVYLNSFLSLMRIVRRLAVMVACVLAWPLALPGAADANFREPEAQPVKLRAETLTPQERMACYLKLLEDFVGWTETNNKFVSGDELEPGGGYFNAAGPGVSWTRGNGCLCAIYAVLLSEFPQRQQFTADKIPRSRLEDHLRKTMRSVCLTHKHCSQHKPSKNDWAGPGWQEAQWPLGVAWAAHLQEEHLDADTLALVKEVVCFEADHLDKPIPSATPGNTSSEDCSWNCPLLAFAANKYADDPRAAKWGELAKKWAVNAWSRRSDRSSMEIVDGRPLKDWIVSENLFPDLTLENHGFWSTPYQFGMAGLGEAAIAYKALGRPVPQAYGLRAAEMWTHIEGVLSLWDGDIFFPHGQDWMWKDYGQTEYFAWQTALRGNPAAGAFESRAVQMLLRQAQGQGGTIGPSADRDRWFGYYTDAFKTFAFACLMHRYSPVTTCLPFDEAETNLLGVHIYPYNKTAIHRTRQKLISVSWHPRSQAILLLPEGSTTFTDPPFFCPYVRTSGVTTVAFPGRQKQLDPKVSMPKIVSDQTGLRIAYYRTWGEALTQFITVASLPDEATAYLSIFRANQDTEVDLGPAFPIQMGQIPGFTERIVAYRGPRWVNYTDHLAFVSPDPLPQPAKPDRFELSGSQHFTVKAGAWFAPAAVVVYMRQPHQQTAALSERIKLDTTPPGKLVLWMTSSSGASTIEANFAE